MPHAFTKFAHPQNATNKLCRGNGLGLALSRRYTWKDFFSYLLYQKLIYCTFVLSSLENICSPMLIYYVFAFSGTFRFVTLMQGNIWLESEGAGKGCTATFFVKLGLSDNKPNANLRRIAPPAQLKQGAAGPDTSSIANSDMTILPLCYQSMV
jgi:ethylene receptor